MHEERDLRQLLCTEPADLAFARDHGRASLVGLTEEGARDCPCCDRPIEKKEVSFFHPNEFLDVLGLGIKGYLFYLGAHTVLFTVMLCLYAIPSLFLRYYEPAPGLNPLQQLGFWEGRSQASVNIQAIISIVSVFLWWGFFYLLRGKFAALVPVRQLYLESKEKEKIEG
jgi:hypothetical protein